MTNLNDMLAEVEDRLPDYDLQKVIRILAEIRMGSEQYGERLARMYLYDVLHRPQRRAEPSHERPPCAHCRDGWRYDDTGRAWPCTECRMPRGPSTEQARTNELLPRR